MKRVILSLIGGVAIPFLYSITVGPLTNYIENPSLRQLMDYPVRWPIIVLEFFLPLDSFLFRDENGTFLILFIIISDVVLYSSLTYIVLLRFWKPKTPQLKQPPDPPQFLMSEDEGS